MNEKLGHVYRATVWTLSAAAAAVDGDRGLEKRIVERRALTVSEFEAAVRDDYTKNVDDEVYFGPISRKDV